MQHVLKVIERGEQHQIEFEKRAHLQFGFFQSGAVDDEVPSTDHVTDHRTVNISLADLASNEQTRMS